MDSSNVIETLNYDYKRVRKKIILLIISSVVLIMISFIMFGKFNNLKEDYIKYSEKSNLNYKVHLKKNNFFEEEYLEKDKQYIANLIDYIQTQFSYNLDNIKNIDEYYYAYGIDATVNVEDKTQKKSIYTAQKNLLPEKISTSNGGIKISEDLKIDYNEYNNLISKFVDVYNLDDTNSTLNVDMYLKIGKTKEEINSAIAEKVASLTIPLTTKTVGIDLSYNLLDSGKESEIFTKVNNGKYGYLVFSIILFVVAIGICIYTMKYFNDTRTDETIYNSKLRRILYTYKSYIQKAELSELNFEGYQTIYIDSFNDLLEIRDTLQEPILMMENKEKTDSHFIIPSKTGILYIYMLGIDTSRKRLAQSNETDDNIARSGAKRYKD